MTSSRTCQDPSRPFTAHACQQVAALRPPACHRPSSSSTAGAQLSRVRRRAKSAARSILAFDLRGRRPLPAGRRRPPLPRPPRVDRLCIPHHPHRARGLPAFRQKFQVNDTLAPTEYTRLWILLHTCSLARAAALESLLPSESDALPFPTSCSMYVPSRINMFFFCRGCAGRHGNQGRYITHASFWARRLRRAPCSKSCTLVVKR
jgi:hypothetical protein